MIRSRKKIPTKSVVPRKKVAKKAAAKKFKATRAAWRKEKGVAPGRDEARKAFIRTMPCFVCVLQSKTQTGKTEAAHLGDEKDGRALGAKANDATVAPLCSEHHTKGIFSHHRQGKRFWNWLGVERETIIARYQKLYAKHQKEHATDAVEGDF